MVRDGNAGEAFFFVTSLSREAGEKCVSGFVCLRTRLVPSIRWNEEKRGERMLPLLLPHSLTV